MIVALDPGHGGTSTGVVKGQGADLLVEKDWVLRLGLILSSRLVHLPGIRTALTRARDIDLGLNEAARIAREADADLALCLHVNSFTDPVSRGLLAFHHPAGDWKAKDAAAVIASHAPLALRRRHPQAAIATTSYQAVRNVMEPFVERRIPCVLVECGFASNNADRAYLTSQTGIHAVANAIEAGVIEFWRLSAAKHAP